MRITVKESERVNEDLLRESGASGVIRKGNGVQIIYGPRVSVIRSNLEDFIHVDTPKAHGAKDDTDHASGEVRGRLVLTAHARGKTVPLREVPDEAFSDGVLGEGVAIEPAEGKLYAPCDGVVEMLADSLHAVNLRTDAGYGILLHVGIDTVSLGGRHFDAHVKAGERVKRGDLLISFDVERIREAGYATVTPMVVCDAEGANVVPLAQGEVGLQDEILCIGTEGER